MATPAAPTIVQGTRSYGASTAANTALLPLVYGNKIHKWWIDRYPTASIVMKVGTVPTPSPLFSHFEQDEVPYFLTANAAGTAAATDFGTSGNSVWGAQFTRFVNGFVYMNVRTLERILVGGPTTTSTAPTAAAINVVRGWGAYPAAAIVAGDKFVLVSTNYTEGTDAPPSISTQEAQYSFRIADFRDAVDLTDRAIGTEWMVEKDLWKREMQMKRHKHMRDIKLSYFFGGAGRSTALSISGTAGIAALGETTGVTGLIDHITSNIWDLNGNIVTQPDLFDFIGSGIAPWNTEKNLIMATSAHVINIVNQWALDKIVPTSQDMKTWGVNIDHLVLMGGRRVALVEETEFNNDPTLRGMAFIGAPQKYSKWRPFKGNNINGETTFFPDIVKENHPTRQKGEWYTSGGWEHFAERSWGFIKGITA